MQFWFYAPLDKVAELTADLLGRGLELHATEQAVGERGTLAVIFTGPDEWRDRYITLRAVADRYGAVYDGWQQTGVS